MRRALVGMALMGAALLFGLATGFPLFYRLVYALALVLGVGMVWAWLGLQGLRVEVRRRATRVQVGEPFEERITITNRWVIPKGWLEVRERSDLPGHAGGMALSLPARGFRSWRVVTRAHRRGLYRLGPVEVRASDPFGLFTFRRTFLSPETLLVYPAVVSIPYFRVLAADLPGEGPLRQRSQALTPHAASVREYMQGDSLARVHWPTTARLGRLMVKEFDQGLGGDMWLLVDMHREVQAGQRSDASDEWAATIAASVAHRYLDAELSVGLLAYGDREVVVPPKRGAGHLLRILEDLATVHAEGTTPLAQVLQREGGRFSHMSILVIITPSGDEEWPLALDTLLRRGVRLVTVLLEPRSFGHRAGAEKVLERLAVLGVPTYLVQKGARLEQALAQPAGLPVAAASARSARGMV
ncbi:MAG: DUF58 domain-containing protein [Dehalococcoidia bacterium]|nr:DUF58 domain-containing protein [Dehalococcoidia bacterium]MDW8120100.1 DUF58 domain-containing protein [Chloroflexota bacterium]